MIPRLKMIMDQIDENVTELYRLHEEIRRQECTTTGGCGIGSLVGQCRSVVSVHGELERLTELRENIQNALAERDSGLDHEDVEAAINAVIVSLQDSNDK